MGKLLGNKFTESLRETMGPAVPDSDVRINPPISAEARAMIIQSVIADIDREYLPMESAYDLSVAQESAGLAIDKVNELLQQGPIEERGEL